jgi:hypothetical protein
VSTTINAFGLGVGNDYEAFIRSDFHMPIGWSNGGAGSLPRWAMTGHRFCLLGDGVLYASAQYLGHSERAHRWEHRPTRMPDGNERYVDAGPGWVLDLDPNTWVIHNKPCDAVGQSYRYGVLDLAEGRFRQVKVADFAVAP